MFVLRNTILNPEWHHKWWHVREVVEEYLRIVLEYFSPVLLRRQFAWNVKSYFLGKNEVLGWQKGYLLTFDHEVPGWNPARGRIELMTVWCFPVGTWRLYNVLSTSMQRHDVASTLRRRCIDVTCCWVHCTEPFIRAFFLSSFHHLSMT